MKLRASEKNVLVFIFFFLPPLFFGYIHIEAISVHKTRFVSIDTTRSSYISSQLESKRFAQEVDSASAQIFLRSDDELAEGLDNISRYAHFLKIQPDIVRHTLYIKHNIGMKAEIADYPNQENKRSVIFPVIIPCDGVEIPQSIVDTEKGTPIKRGLKLSDQENSDRAYVEEIIKNCYFLENTPVGAKNTLGQRIYMYPESITLTQNARIDLIIRPDHFSKVAIYISWIIFLVGFLILLREGPWKHIEK